MKADLYRRLEAAARVRDFCRTHPTEDAGYASVLARLEQALTRSDILAVQERDGRNTVRAASKRRRDLRRLLQVKLLPQLVRVAELASAEEPDLAGRLRLPNPSSRYAAFLTAARSLLEAAKARQELLARHGLPAAALDELAIQLEQFETVTRSLHAARTDHVGARGELAALTSEVGRLVGVLDGLNRFRFRNDPELESAWASAKNVIAPVRPKPAPPPADQGGPAQAA